RSSSPTMPRRPSRVRVAIWPMAPTQSSSSPAHPGSTSSPVSPHSPTGRSSRTSRSTSTHRSSPRPKDPSTRRRPSANISPPRDARAPASLSRQVPGASPSHEQDSPLSVLARLGLYAMLAGLVVASFTVTPTRRAQVSAAPTVDDEPPSARIAPMSRGLVREFRDVDGLEVAASPTPTAEAIAAPAIEVVPDALPEATAQPETEPVTAPDPTPE